MAIESVKMWKTSDGEMHETKEAAIANEVNLELKKLDMGPDQLYRSDPREARKAINELIYNLKNVIALLDELK